MPETTEDRGPEDGVPPPSSDNSESTDSADYPDSADSSVSGGSTAGTDTTVGGGTTAGTDTAVGGGATVSSDTTVGGGSPVSSETTVSGGSPVSSDTTVGGGSGDRRDRRDSGDRGRHADREDRDAEERDAAALLAPLTRTDGFVGACLVDPGSGTLVGSVPPPASSDMTPLAAGAADVVHVLTVMGAQWAVDAEVEDVVVTTTDHQHLVRVVERGPGETRLVVLTLDRTRSRLALALRELRDAGGGPPS